MRRRELRQQMKKLFEFFYFLADKNSHDIKSKIHFTLQ